MKDLKRKIDAYFMARPNARGLLVTLCLISFAASLWLNVADKNYQQLSTAHFIALSVAYVFQVAFIILISSLYRDLYWVKLPQKSPSDERERSLRQQIYERSYLYVCVMTFLLIFWLVNATPHFAYPGTALMSIVFMYYAIPSLTAAFTPDSNLDFKG